MPNFEIDVSENDLIELNDAMSDFVAGGAGKADLVSDIYNPRWW